MNQRYYLPSGRRKLPSRHAWRPKATNMKVHGAWVCSPGHATCKDRRTMAAIQTSGELEAWEVLRSWQAAQKTVCVSLGRGDRGSRFAVIAGTLYRVQQAARAVVRHVQAAFIHRTSHDLATITASVHATPSVSLDMTRIKSDVTCAA